MAHLVTLLPWLVVGALVGLAAALLSRERAGDGLITHVAVGIAAALLTGGWLAPRLGIPVGRPVAQVLGALGLSLFGAVIAAAVVQWLLHLNDAHPRDDHPSQEARP